MPFGDRTKRRRPLRLPPLRPGPLLLPGLRPPVPRQRSCRCARGLGRRHDRRHHHALEQVDRLAGAQLVGRAGQIADAGRCCRRWPPACSPATDRPGSGRCPRRDPVRSAPRSGSRWARAAHRWRSGVSAGSVERAAGVVSPGVVRPPASASARDWSAPDSCSAGLASAGSVSDGPVAVGRSVALGAVRPGVVSPGVVRPGVVRPGAVRPGAVSPVSSERVRSDRARSASSACWRPYPSTGRWASAAG